MVKVVNRPRSNRNPTLAAKGPVPPVIWPRLLIPVTAVVPGWPGTSIVVKRPRSHTYPWKMPSSSWYWPTTWVRLLIPTAVVVTAPGAAMRV
jgi:hypothetical protein